MNLDPIVTLLAVLAVLLWVLSAVAFVILLVLS